MQQLNTLSVIIIILFVEAFMFAFSLCKMSCESSKEGMQSHRLTNTHLLEDDAYGVGELSAYTLPKGWHYKLPSHDKENYSDVFLCNKKCGTIASATPRSECMQNCMNSSIGKTQTANMYIPCSGDGNCSDENHVCVSPSYYGGGNQGYCMDANEPGIPKFKDRMRENYKRSQEQYHRSKSRILSDYSSETCLPGYFRNESTGSCENRFQGRSSAIAVHMSKPVPGPEVTLPGSTFPGYGIGYFDPVDVPVPARLKTDQ